MAQKELDTGCSEDPDLLSTRQSVEQKREIAKLAPNPGRHSQDGGKLSASARTAWWGYCWEQYSKHGLGWPCLPLTDGC